MRGLRPLVKCHGGKFYLQLFLYRNWPNDYERRSYGEFHVGGGSVFFNQARLASGCQVWLADKSKPLIAIYQAIKTELDEFMRSLRSVRYTEATFLNAMTAKPVGLIETAVNEYILRRMSRDGLRKNFAWSERKRGGKPGDVNAWLTAIQQLPELSRRLNANPTQLIAGKSVELLETAAKTGKPWFVYLDPPYLPHTRTAKTAYAEYEMSPEEHEQLLKMCLQITGSCDMRIAISGNPSELYDDYLMGWERDTRQIVNHSAQTKTKKVRTEVLWKNYRNR